METATLVRTPLCELLKAGMDVIVFVFDNLCNSHPVALARVAQITGKKPALVQGDIRDSGAWELVCAPAVPRLSYTLRVTSQLASRCKSRGPIYHNVAGSLNVLQTP